MKKHKPFGPSADGLSGSRFSGPGMRIALVRQFVLKLF
jgi:hypothetical protein